MDSLTQIVLGAAVGEAVLGKKVGNKAMLYGAIAGTIPDLDVVTAYFTDTVTAISWHRGFTHSIVFSVVFALIFGWIVARYEKHKNFKDWSWLFFLAFVTHPILDAHTTWGTQLFWPLDLRLAFKTIFVIDPMYTVPFLVFLILAMQQKRTASKRSFYNLMGIGISSGYLLVTIILKFVVTEKFANALQSQDITYQNMDTRPAPFNTILWNANVETADAFLLGDYSFFDSQPVAFASYPKNHHLLGELKKQEPVQRMMAITQNWFTITQKNGDLYFNDLRFGLLSATPGSTNFVFQYQITQDRTGKVVFTEVKKDTRDGKKLLAELWQRVKGN